jgi:WD40 repeat protein
MKAKSAAKAKYLSDLTACGWFEKVPKSAASRLRKAILSSKDASPWPAAMPVCIDPECIYEEGDYSELLKQFADNSGGLFKPIRISEKWNEVTARLEFSHAGRKYSTELSLESDWADEKVFSIVKKAMKDSNSPLHFLEFDDPDGGQELFFSLATPAALKKARKRRLIPSKEAYEEQYRIREQELKRTFSFIEALAFTPDNELIISGGQQHRVYRWQTGELIKEFFHQPHASDRTMALRDGRILLADTGGATIWNPADNSTRRLLGYEDGTRKGHSLLTPDGRWLITNFYFSTPGRPSLIQVWDVDERKTIREWEVSNHLLHSLVLSPTGKRLAAGTRDNTVSVWNLNGKKVQEFSVPWHPKIAWHPREDVLACVAGQEISFYAAGSGKLLRKCDYRYTAQNAQQWCTFAPDGTFIITWGGADGSLSRFEYPSGKRIATVRLHDDYTELKKVIMLPGSSVSASGGTIERQSCIVFYDWTEQRIIATLKGARS